MKKKSHAYLEELMKADKKVNKRKCIAVPEMKAPSAKIKIKPSTGQMEKIRNNRTKIFKIARAAVFAILLVTVLYIGINNYLENKSYVQAYEVYLDDEYICNVETIEQFESCMFRVQNELADELDDEVKISQKPEYKEIKIKSANLTPVDEIEEKLRERIKYFVGAYAIIADGKEMALLKSKDEAQWVLDEIKKQYEVDGPDIRLQFASEVSIKKRHVNPSVIKDKYNALENLTKLKEEIQYYTVNENDTLWDIALDHKIPVEEILRINPGISENIHPGEKLALGVPTPVLPVEVREKIKYNADIPYDIKEVPDSELYQGRRSIIEKGVNGEKLVTAELIKINGVEVDKEVLNETVLFNPRTQVEKVGTKELPPKYGTGVFGRPLYGIITSRFGMRWGRQHNGIDIAGNVGDEIVAADGGKVIYSGWLGDYGYLVQISHDNEYVSFYGHCSKLLVEVGQRVAKGEVIAEVGSTGRSTGPHLHFEVRKNGVPVNPLKYVSY